MTRRIPWFQVAGLFVVVCTLATTGYWYYSFERTAIRDAKLADLQGIADVVEAKASDRQYRAALGIDAAHAEIQRGRGTAYWSDAVDACVKVFREDGYVLPLQASPGFAGGLFHA
jgi:hypothetical protein